MARDKQANTNAGGRAMAERKHTRPDHDGRARKAAPRTPAATAGSRPAGDPPEDGSSPEQRIDSRLARIEEALATESGRSQELLARLAQANQVKQSLERSAARLGGGSVDGQIADGLERALRLRRENVVPADQPLALICQAQRSGGTLLGRLFDGHPQCHAHPHELLIGGRIAHEWPQLSLGDEPDVWFAKLQEEKVIGLFAKGRRRIPLKTAGDKPEGAYPAILPPSFQRLIFLDEVERRSPIRSQRQILDCYMTSLFNAWLDYQNLQGPQKRWVVAFSPRRAWGDGLDKFFELYPDGRLISILRDPLSWYTSAQGRDSDADPDALLENWKRSAEEMLIAARRYGERVRIVRFDEMLLDTPGTMRGLADFLEIDYDQQLTIPTFNRYPVGANSSYGVQDTGVVTDPVERYRKLLSEDQRKMIRAECEDLHQEVLAIIDNQVPAGAALAEPISLATATVEQLSAIEGLRPRTARHIIEFRDERGSISSIDELDEISGIGPATMKALRERLQP